MSLKISKGIKSNEKDIYGCMKCFDSASNRVNDSCRVVAPSLKKIRMDDPGAKESLRQIK